MYSFDKHMTINAPVADCWAKIIQFDAIDQWFHTIQSAGYTNNIRESKGMQRRLIQSTGTIIETVDIYKPEQEFGYTIEGFALAKTWHNHWYFKADSDKTQVTLTTTYEASIPLIGGLLEGSVLKALVNNAFTDLMASFKYVVEHDAPPPSAHALPRSEIS